MDSIKVTFLASSLSFSSPKLIFLTQGFKKMHTMYQSTYSNCYLYQNVQPAIWN